MKQSIIWLIATGLVMVGCREEKNKITGKSAKNQDQEQLSPCIGNSCELPPRVLPNKEVTKNLVTGSNNSVENDKVIKPKRLWAKSFLWVKSPKIEVEKWVGEEPDLTKQKFILLEFWNTWCQPCRNSLPKLTELQQKFSKDLIVIALSNESVTDIKALEKKHGVKLPGCYIASSPQRKTEFEFGVRGVPHAVIIEPENGCVIWEGFPLQEGHKLTSELLQKIIKIGKQ